MRYDAQKYLTAPACASPEIWRLLLGLGLMAGAYIAMGRAYFTLLAEVVTPGAWPQLAAEIERGSTARGMLALLASFGLVILSVGLVARLLHGRSLASLFGDGRIFTRQTLRVATALTGFAGILWLLPEPEALTPFHNIDFIGWLALLPLSVPLLLIQVSAEELLFRGYLQSQLAARFRSVLAYIVLPALVFGLLHYDRELAGPNAWALALSATLFGLAAGDLTARAGTLAPAIALHFFINAMALLYVAPSDTLHGLALYTYPFAISDPSLRPVWLPYDLMILLCAWLAARLAIGR
ncbi:CPBP family intramembrane metalloprotease [Rhodobacteraceae bacterium 63075]|nr:CPBP family intramembrane metalloprotease [Rhodobacteraceae bacterium 63075]